MGSGRKVLLFGLTLVVGLTGCQAGETGEVDPGTGEAMSAPEASTRMNPMIALHEADLPVFGITPPAISAGRGRGAAEGAEPPPQPDLNEVARETLAYGLADFQYGGANPDERFLQYVDAMIAQGGTAKTHAFIAKTRVFHEDPAAATARIHAQLDAGHVGVMTEAVESPEEIQQVINAMRFVSKGGTRPETNIERAAAFWGMSTAEYLEKADVWPLNPEGELILWAIVESAEGLARVREIAATPGIGVLWAGAGTLGGVFTTEDANGERVRDEAGYQAALASVLAACQEFDVPCGFPASNAEDVERLRAEGWSVMVMQQRNENGLGAIDAGRRLSGRPTTATPASTP